MHPPVYGSSPKSVDDSAALKVAGVKQTATLDTFKPPIGYQALGGVGGDRRQLLGGIPRQKKLKVDWTKSDHSAWNSDAFRKEMEATSRKPCKWCGKTATLTQNFRRAAKSVKRNTMRQCWPTPRWSHRPRWPFSRMGR